MPYEFSYEWSEPRPNNYDESFINSTRKTLELRGYTFYMDEYDLDESSIYWRLTHRLDLRVVNPIDKYDYLIWHYESYEELENAVEAISQFISNTTED